MADAPPRAHEATPLLPRPHDGDDEPPRLRGRRFTTLLTVCIFFISLGAAMTDLPALRILEDIICRRHMAGTVEHIDESLCKDKEVQGEVAYIMAMLSMFAVVPGLIMGFPYGLLADRIGRRPVLALVVLGMACSLSWMMFVIYNISYFDNPRLIWTGHVWLLIGGGKHVLIAISFSMIADVEPAEKLSDAFFMLIVASLGANLLATFLSAQLMRIDPWIPALLGLAILAFGGLLILLLPETLHTKPPSAAPDAPPPQHASLAAALRARASGLIADLRQSASLLHSYPVVALLLTFLTTGVHARALEFSPQYISKSLGWTLSDAGMLLSGQVVLNIALYVVIIPGLSRLLTSPQLPFRLDPPVKDLILARASGAAISVGAFLLAMPNTVAAVAGLVLFTLGLGFGTLCRVVVTALVDASQTARLYTLISVLSAGGELAAGPVIAWLFKVGMGMGDGMAGLPYLGVAGFCAIAAVGVFTVRRSSLVGSGGVVGSM